jgi:hypothetical protein
MAQCQITPWEMAESEWERLLQGWKGFRGLIHFLLAKGTWEE